MSNPLHAAYYADHAACVAAVIVENVRLARDTYRVRFASPEIARRIVPGQFLMLRLAGRNDPLIGRPLALYDTVPDTSGRTEAVDVVYLVKGKFTSRLCQLGPGDRLEAWGPLGNGFMPSTQYSVLGTQYSMVTQDSHAKSQDSRTPTPDPRAPNPEPRAPSHPHLLMVAGGIGQTPFLALAQEALGLKQYGEGPRHAPKVEKITFCYGARTADYFAGLADFERLGIDIRLATDDGTRGHHGLVTDLVKQVLVEQKNQATKIACCGPEPMMEAVAKIALAENIPCQVSLETPMACGIGICFTCVAKIRQPDGAWDYKRTCVDGPIFDAALVEW